jgi:hypothetical protein
MNNNKQYEALRTLELLQAIEQRGDLSRRHLARRMAALGLANSCFKRDARKSLIDGPAGACQPQSLLPDAEALRRDGPADRRIPERLAQLRSVRLGFLCSCPQRLQARARTGAWPVRRLDVAISLIHARWNWIWRWPARATATTPAHFFVGAQLMRSMDRTPAVDAWMIIDLRDPHGTLGKVQGRAGTARVVAPDRLSLGLAAHWD